MNFLIEMSEILNRIKPTLRPTKLMVSLPNMLGPHFEVCHLMQTPKIRFFSESFKISEFSQV